MTFDINNYISNEINGKNTAIHAYDKMMWTVRTGFLTLVFGGWALFLKSAIEVRIALKEFAPYVIVLSGFTIVLAMGAYLIDRNYARRKFRVITAFNELIDCITAFNLEKTSVQTQKELGTLLKISGDAANKSYRSNAFENEMFVCKVIYLLPLLLVIGILTYLKLNP